MSSRQLIVRIKGGLGNQLYGYAAARRLAFVNNMELVIDDITGFSRDYQFKREYTLDCFNILARKATAQERLEPFERARRAVRKKIQNLKKFENRNYLEQEFDDFDSRILNLQLNKDVYLDGLWQSEYYFKDIENLIREDLIITPPVDDKNLSTAKQIEIKKSVAIHIRWFDQDSASSDINVQLNYYQMALNEMENLLDKPYYFIFSDNPKKAKELIELPIGRFEFITHNKMAENAIWDFWLMSQCENFIISNSTFSWWAAWLSSNNEKYVIYPILKKDMKNKWNWGYEGQMPKKWKALIL